MDYAEVHALLASIDAALATSAPVLGDGWDTGRLARLRAALARDRESRERSRSIRSALVAVYTAVLFVPSEPGEIRVTNQYPRDYPAARAAVEELL